MELKKCTKCGENKPATAEYFHKNGRNLRTQCKVCRSQPKEKKLERWVKKRNQYYKERFGYEYENGYMTATDISRQLQVDRTSIVDTFSRYNITKDYRLRAQKVINKDFCFVVSENPVDNLSDPIYYKCPIHGVQSGTIEQIERINGCEKCVNYNIAKELCDERDLILYSTEIPTESSRIVVECREHGKFDSNILNLKRTTTGCWKCGVDYRVNKLTDEWGEFGWENKVTVERNKAQMLAVNSYVYIVRLYDENESFYKIGIANNINHRMWNIPYGYEVVKAYKVSRYDAVYLERSLHKYHEKYKYTPKKDFGGKTECFSKILIKE